MTISTEMKPGQPILAMQTSPIIKELTRDPEWETLKKRMFEFTNLSLTEEIEPYALEFYEIGKRKKIAKTPQQNSAVLNEVIRFWEKVEERFSDSNGIEKIHSLETVTDFILGFERRHTDFP